MDPFTSHPTLTPDELRWIITASGLRQVPFAERLGMTIHEYTRANGYRQRQSLTIQECLSGKKPVSRKLFARIQREFPELVQAVLGRRE